MEEERRRHDDKTIAILNQKFDDFVDNTEKYRKAQEKIQESISDKLEQTTTAIFNKLANLQCPIHNTRIEDMGKAIIGLWIIVGTIGITVLTEVIRFWNK